MSVSVARRAGPFESFSWDFSILRCSLLKDISPISWIFCWYYFDDWDLMWLYFICNDFLFSWVAGNYSRSLMWSAKHRPGLFTITSCSRLSPVSCLIYPPVLSYFLLSPHYLLMSSVSCVLCPVQSHINACVDLSFIVLGHFHSLAAHLIGFYSLLRFTIYLR